MEEELVRQIEKSELEMSIGKLDGYINAMDARLEDAELRLDVLEMRFEKMDKVQRLLVYLEKELGLSVEKVAEPVETRSAVRQGDTDVDEGG